MRTSANQLTLQRIGAICAVLGTALQVAAGSSESAGFGTVPASADAATLLPILASGPTWFWTVLHSGFILGPVFWVIAFVALASTLTPTLESEWGNTLEKLAVVTILVGAGVHIFSSATNGFAVPALARAWQSADPTEQATLTLVGDVLLSIIDGTWAVSITLFHGLPFVLSGLAVVSSRRYPAFVGWLGFIGGLGSLIAGPLLFFDVEGWATGLSIVSAVVISVYMVVLGLLMWNPSRDEQRDNQDGFNTVEGMARE